MELDLNLSEDRRGQAQVIWTVISIIMAAIIGIVFIYQLFISGVGPTDKPYLDNENKPTKTPTATPNPKYDADALDAYNRTKALAWVGIGICVLMILVVALVPLMAIFRGGAPGQV